MKPDGIIEAGQLAHDDGALWALAQAPAVFLIHAGEGRPYLARTTMLRRRAARLLGRRDTASRMFTLRASFTRMEYWSTGSALDASMRMYELARQYFPDEYVRIIRLRLPSYVKLLLANDWPRTIITSRLGGGKALAYGPFRSRTAAEQFESEFLDLYQIRRCQEDLAPAADHPGCIYGEMNKCLRPCQVAVGHDEYGNEVARAGDFLRSDGRSLIRSIASARDALSAEMEFEEAARQHRRMERVQEVLKLRDELAGSVEQLNAITVTRSAVPQSVDLCFLRAGTWQGATRLGFELEDGKPVSIDRKLREICAAASSKLLPGREREERLALLARWFYSTWRDGELLAFTDFGDPPIRKLVNAIARVMAGALVSDPQVNKGGTSPPKPL